MTTPTLKTLTLSTLLIAASMILPLTATAEAGAQAKKKAIPRPPKAVVLETVGGQDQLKQLSKSTAEQVLTGNERGNGGDAVVLRDGTVRFLDLVREPRAEILDPELEGLTELMVQEMQKHRGLRLGAYIPAGIDSKVTSISQGITTALGRLTFYLVPGPLPEVNDRGVVVLPWNLRGQVVRLALQERESGRVVVDRRYYSQLPTRDRVAFMMHEALIRMWNEDFNNGELTSTERIANFVHILFNRTGHMPEGMPEKIATRYLCDAGYLVSNQQVSGWKKMNGVLSTSGRYSPTQNALIFRRDGRCHTAMLRLTGPFQGEWSNAVHPYDKLIKYQFEETAENYEKYSAAIALLKGFSGVEEFWFESNNPDTPMIFGANYQTFTSLRVTVLKYD